MRSNLVFSLLALLAVLSAAADEKAQAYALSKGGMVFRLQEEQLAAQPGYTLDILPDGTVRENGDVAKAKLTAEELQALIRFADRDCGIFEHDEKALARALGKPPMGCGVGSTTTVITLTLKGKTKTVRVPLLRTNADRLPNVKSLQKVLALNDRLRLEARLAKSGGRKKVEVWLAAANARMKKRFPKERPFCIEEFKEVRELPPQGEGAFPANWDPNDQKLEGTAATFMRYGKEPYRILTAIVTTGKKPIASVNIQK